MCPTPDPQKMTRLAARAQGAHRLFRAADRLAVNLDDDDLGAQASLAGSAFPDPPR